MQNTHHANIDAISVIIFPAADYVNPQMRTNWIDTKLADFVRDATLYSYIHLKENNYAATSVSDRADRLRQKHYDKKCSW
jgi:hypothetical protein